MKTILVTGGNRGIGFEICRQLDELGHTVILGARDLERGKEAAKILSDRVMVCQLDVTDESSLQNLYQFIQTKTSHLDVLINNAGIYRLNNNEKKAWEGTRRFMDKNLQVVGKVARKITPILRSAGIMSGSKGPSTVFIPDVKILMETNFYGAWRMIQIFLPMLKRSADARIINMSSGNGQFEGMSLEHPSYSLSKASLNALTILFSKELEKYQIKVNAMCPGWVKTDMGGPNAPRSVDEGADTAVWLATAEDIPTGKFFRDREIQNW